MNFWLMIGQYSGAKSSAPIVHAAGIFGYVTARYLSSTQAQLLVVSRPDTAMCLAAGSSLLGVSLAECTVRQTVATVLGKMQ